MNPVKVGNYYRELDNRFIRYVVVVGILHGKGTVFLQTVGLKKRYTRAKIERFNGRKGGYAPVTIREVKDYLLERAR